MVGHGGPNASPLTGEQTDSLGPLLKGRVDESFSMRLTAALMLVSHMFLGTVMGADRSTLGRAWATGQELVFQLSKELALDSVGWGWDQDPGPLGPFQSLRLLQGLEQTWLLSGQLPH